MLQKSTQYQAKSVVFSPQLEHQNFNWVNSKIKISKIQNINLDEQTQLRSGVIPYIVDGNNVLFCLGRDTDSYDLTDFGGGVKNEDVTPIIGGLREFKEESLDIFGKISSENLLNEWAIYSDKMMIMFVKFDVKPRVIIEKFRNKVRKIKNPEVSDVVWLSKDDLINIITNFKSKVKMYYRVRNLLKEAIPTIKLIGNHMPH